MLTIPIPDGPTAATLLLAVGTGVLAFVTWLLSKATTASLNLLLTERDDRRERELARLSNGYFPIWREDDRTLRGTIDYDHGTDPAVELRVLVRRGTLFWRGVFLFDKDFVLPRSSSGDPRGKVGYGAIRCNPTDVHMTLAPPDHFMAPGKGAAVVVLWTSQGTAMAWACLYELVDGELVPVGTPWTGQDPPSRERHV
jgi:hypothetical protein